MFLSILVVMYYESLKKMAMVGTKTENQEMHTHSLTHNKTVLQFNISILICTFLSFISSKKLWIKIYILKIWVFQQLLGALLQSCIYTGVH